jgi:CRP/FNR family cyclic AMP-dependent transcriptional regulator
MPVMPEGRSGSAAAPLTFDEAVERVPFLRALPIKVREHLRPVAELRYLAEGEPAFSLGQPSQEFLFLVRGHVKLMKSRDDGREVILDLRGPGDLLCAGAVSAFAPYCCTAVALDGDINVMAFPRREMHRLLEEHAPAGALFVQQASHNEMRLAGRVFELTSGHVEQRISALLLRLSEQNGTVQPDGSLRISVKLSRQDLADLCGTTLESAIRTMTHLARENIVSTAIRGFVITDRARLEALARGADA